jgi:hypothetical protein
MLSFTRGLAFGGEVPERTFVCSRLRGEGGGNLLRHEDSKKR